MVLSSWQSHCESSPGSFDECRMAPSGRRPMTKPDDLGCESACTGCQKLHPPSPFIITQPKSWYSFYHPTEGRRLSRPTVCAAVHSYIAASIRRLICRRFDTEPEPTGSGPNQGSGRFGYYFGYLTTRVRVVDSGPGNPLTSLIFILAITVDIYKLWASFPSIVL